MGQDYRIYSCQVDILANHILYLNYRHKNAALIQVSRSKIANQNSRVWKQTPALCHLQARSENVCSPMNIQIQM